MKKILLAFILVVATTSVFAQPANDLCAGATIEPQNGTCLAGTLVNATDNWIGTVGCQTGNHPEVWYTFVATGTLGTWTITEGTMTGNIEFVLGTGTSCTNPITI